MGLTMKQAADLGIPRDSQEFEHELEELRSSAVRKRAQLLKLRRKRRRLLGEPVSGVDSSGFSRDSSSAGTIFFF